MNIKRKNNLIIVCFLALMFFLFTSLFISFNQPEGGYYRWSSPDESANYYFTLNYANNKSLSSYDPAGIITQGWTTPRSMRNDSGFIKPVSFLGIIIVFGSLASFFGNFLIPILTPLFAAIGIIVFYLLTKKLFNDKIALYSAFLLSFFPVYIYYSIRALFHNVLFIVFFLLGLYFISSIFLKNKEKVEGFKVSFAEKIRKFFGFSGGYKKYLSFLSSFLAGIFIGLAIITRTSELLWLLPFLLIWWIFYFKKVSFLDVVVFLSAIFFALLPSAYYNQILYGSYFYGGYNELNTSVNEISNISSGLFSSFNLSFLRESLLKLYDLIFYFGFKPRQSLSIFNDYVVKMFPFIFWPGVFGFLLVFIKNTYKRKRKINFYILAGLFVSFFLVMYYGSWKFSDNPGVGRVTIGNSYTRYWLPIYLWLMPLASWFLVYFSEALFSFNKIAKKTAYYLKLGLQSVFILIYIIFSLSFVFFGSEEGLVYWRYNNILDKNMAKVAISKTEEDAIVVTRHFDKLIFPDRRVIVASFPDDDLSLAVSKLVDIYPVYYLHFTLNENDIKYLNERRLNQHNLEIEALAMTGINTYLYKIDRVKNNTD